MNGAHPEDFFIHIDCVVISYTNNPVAGEAMPIRCPVVIRGINTPFVELCMSSKALESGVCVPTPTDCALTAMERNPKKQILTIFFILMVFLRSAVREKNRRR